MGGLGLGLSVHASGLRVLELAVSQGVVAIPKTIRNPNLALKRPKFARIVGSESSYPTQGCGGLELRAPGANRCLKFRGSGSRVKCLSGLLLSALN